MNLDDLLPGRPILDVVPMTRPAPAPRPFVERDAIRRLWQLAET